MKHNQGKRQAQATTAGKGKQLFSMVILFSMLLLASAVVFAEDSPSYSYSATIEKRLEGNIPGADTKNFDFTVILPDGKTQTLELGNGKTGLFGVNDSSPTQIYTITETNANVKGYTWTPSATVNRSQEISGKSGTIYVSAEVPLTITRPDKVGTSEYIVKADKADSAPIEITINDGKKSAETVPLAPGFYNVTEKQWPGLFIKNEIEAEELLEITLKDGDILTIKAPDNGSSEYRCFVNDKETEWNDGSVILDTPDEYAIYVTEAPKGKDTTDDESDEDVDIQAAPAADEMEEAAILDASPEDNEALADEEEAVDSLSDISSTGSGSFIPAPNNDISLTADDKDTSLDTRHVPFTAVLEFTVTGSINRYFPAGNLTIKKVFDGDNAPEDHVFSVHFNSNDDNGGEQEKSLTLDPEDKWEVGKIHAGHYDVGEDPAGFTLSISFDLKDENGDSLLVKDKDGNYTLSTEMFGWESLIQKNDTIIITNNYTSDDGSGNTIGSYKYIHEYYFEKISPETLEGKSDIGTISNLPLDSTEFTGDNIDQVNKYTIDGEEHTYSYEGAVYGSISEADSSSYSPDSEKDHVVATENGAEIIILRYVRTSSSNPSNPPEESETPTNPPTNPPTESPTTPPTPVPSVEPTPEPNPDPEPDPEPTHTPNPQLPNPNDPESPEEVILIEDGVPLTYKKLWDPVTEEWEYVLDDEVPLSTVPQTGDPTSPLFLLSAMALSLGGIVALLPRKREEF